MLCHFALDETKRSHWNASTCEFCILIDPLPNRPVHILREERFSRLPAEEVAHSLEQSCEMELSHTQNHSRDTPPIPFSPTNRFHRAGSTWIDEERPTI